MKIKIESQKENQLLKRKDIHISVEGNTPTRKDLLKQIAAETGKNDDLISIDKIRQDFGKNKSEIHAKIYNTTEDRNNIERKYKIERTEGKKGDKDGKEKQETDKQA